jgi:hypothetical protein
MKENIKNKDIAMLLLVIVTFFIVTEISSSLISNMRINDGDVRSLKDLKCYWIIDQNSNVNVTWYRNGIQNLTATVSCTSGVECYTSMGSGTVPNSYTTKGDEWRCSISFWNGTNIEMQNTSVIIANTPPSKPEVFWDNGTRIINITAIIKEDYTTVLDLNATDEDNDVLTYSISNYEFCNINNVSGTMSCNPTEESQLGVRTITMYVDDKDGGISYDYLTINVTPTNDAPTFSPELTTQNLTEGQAFNYHITGIDDENNIPFNLTVYNISPSGYLNLEINRINDTDFILMLENNHNATYFEASYNYTVELLLNDTDNITNNSKSTIYSFQLVGITFNHLPIISYVVYNNSSIIQGGNLSIYINATDIDNNNMTFYTNTIRYLITYTSDTNHTKVPNASFAYAWVNITGLTNDNVIYNNFTVFAYDTNQNGSQPINFTILNLNDAPTINEISTYTEINSFNNSNISSMMAYTGILFRYKVNASDIDDQTYDYANSGLGIYSTNDSTLFPINSSTGILGFTPNNIGNFSFIITVTDNGGLTYNRTANIEVLKNNDPIFTEDPIIIQCYEYDATNYPYPCYYDISYNVTDIDDGDNISKYWTNSTLFVIDNATGVINFVAYQPVIGNYSITLNATDSRGGMNSTTIYLTITNTNNPPALEEPDMPSENMVVGSLYHIIYTATDLDLNIGNTYENLTFTSNITGRNTNVFNITKISATLAELFITPIAEDYEGNYSINITVTDYYGNTSSHYSTIYIYNATLPPNITSIIPSGTPYNDTIDAINWMSTSYFPDMTTTINIYENNTYTFNQTSYADNSSYPNSLNYSWYYDNIFVAATQYYQKNFNFFSNGTHNLTILVKDQYNSSSSFEWIINVVNVNRPPIYNNGSLQNLTIYGSGYFPDYLTYSSGQKRFYDPDDDPENLGYSRDNSTSLAFSSTLCAFADFTFDQKRLNIVAHEIGECIIKITATDTLNSSLSVTSEFILINITNISESNTPQEVPINTESTGGGTNTRPLPLPLPQEVEKPVPLRLFTPQLVTTYKNATIKIPIVINNTWNDTLIGITLEAETNSSNVSLYLDKTYIPKLDKGESTEATLYAYNYKSEGHYEIRVIANVSIPAYEDFATIFINSADMNSEGEELESKISFAQDLLSSNPECQELYELLDRAKSELNNNNYVATGKIIDNVLNGCKYLVNNAKENTEAPDRGFIKTFEWRKFYGDYIIIGLFGILFIASLYYILKKDDSEKTF